jgi:DNA-binding response OmpR family regulator
MAHILLVEPDVVLAKTYQQTLERSGHVIMCSASAQESILAMDHKKPDIIVLELRLADHNGIEFLYELRSYSDWQNVPVVIHSMVSPSEAKVNWGLLGVDAYLYKPKTSLRKLQQTVDDILNGVNGQ